MGKKDATAIFTPVDQYRKHIGKQDTKKNKAELTQVKKRSHFKKAPEGRSARVGIWILLVFLISLCGVYLLLYYYLQYKSDQVKALVQAVERAWFEKISPYLDENTLYNKTKTYFNSLFG